MINMLSSGVHLKYGIKGGTICKVNFIEMGLVISESIGVNDFHALASRTT